ncbi:MAG: hypothetical protein SGPRY_002333 [Prymnesium sp.]
MARTKCHRPGPALREEETEGEPSDEGDDDLPIAKLLKKRRLNQEVYLRECARACVSGLRVWEGVGAPQLRVSGSDRGTRCAEGGQWCCMWRSSVLCMGGRAA